MDISQFMAREGEMPLDQMVVGGGFTGIFRTIGCIGDSLSSGEFESMDEKGTKGYHDMYGYSWGQFIAREAGVEVRNFSQGGLTAGDYRKWFADEHDYWNEKYLCQAYIIAMGANEIYRGDPFGTVQDIKSDYKDNADTFMGNMGYILSRIRRMQPQARFFLMTMPREEDEERDKLFALHAEKVKQLSLLFPYTYVIDFNRYAPVYDEAFRRNFYLGGHLNPQGYILTARMVMSYIDWIVRQDPELFAQVPFIGKPYYNMQAKW